jgi:hypothetical protein
MDPFKPRRNSKNGPESKVQSDLVAFLTLREWYVKETHGNMYQSGLPDLYICHRQYGARWVEVKYLEKYSFTPAQLETFPHFAAKGIGVWILTAATEDEYRKLFGPANWYTFLSIMKV